MTLCKWPLRSNKISWHMEQDNSLNPLWSIFVASITSSVCLSSLKLLVILVFVPFGQSAFFLAFLYMTSHTYYLDQRLTYQMISFTPYLPDTMFEFLWTNCCHLPRSLSAAQPSTTDLIHWGRMTHICVSKLTIIGSDNGLSSSWCQAIIRGNAGMLIIGPRGTNLKF